MSVEHRAQNCCKIFDMTKQQHGALWAYNYRTTASFRVVTLANLSTSGDKFACSESATSRSVLSKHRLLNRCSEIVDRRHVLTLFRQEKDLSACADDTGRVSTNWKKIALRQEKHFSLATIIARHPLLFVLFWSPSVFPLWHISAISTYHCQLTNVNQTVGLVVPWVQNSRSSDCLGISCIAFAENLSSSSLTIRSMIANISLRQPDFVVKESASTDPDPALDITWKSVSAFGGCLRLVGGRTVPSSDKDTALSLGTGISLDRQNEETSGKSSAKDASFRFAFMASIIVDCRPITVAVLAMSADLPCMNVVADESNGKSMSSKCNVKTNLYCSNCAKRPVASTLSLPFKLAQKCDNKPCKQSNRDLNTITALCLQTHWVSLCLGSVKMPRPACCCNAVKRSCRNVEAFTKQ